MSSTLNISPVDFKKWELPPEVVELYTACDSGQLETVQDIVSQWFTKQILPEKKARLDGCFPPALTAAVATNHHVVTAYLRPNELIPSTPNLPRPGWDINQPLGRFDPPALTLAFDDENLTKWFLDHGANPNAPCGWDCTPLSMAVLREPFRVISLLFAPGGLIRHGQLLHYAAAREAPDRLNVLELFLDLGAPLNEIMYQNVPSNYYEQAAFGLGTPLHKTAELGRTDVVQYLLSKGANSIIKNSRGYTATEVAERKGYDEVVALLRSSRPARI